MKKKNYISPEIETIRVLMSNVVLNVVSNIPVDDTPANPRCSSGFFPDDDYE